jgi:hypothetical protein
MFAVLHSDINSLKSGLLHLTGQPHSKKCRSAKVKGGIINLILRNYLTDQYIDQHILKLKIPLAFVTKEITLMRRSTVHSLPCLCFLLCPMASL